MKRDVTEIFEDTIHRLGVEGKISFPYTKDDLLEVWKSGLAQAGGLWGERLLEELKQSCHGCEYFKRDEEGFWYMFRDKPVD